MSSYELYQLDIFAHINSHFINDKFKYMKVLKLFALVLMLVTVIVGCKNSDKLSLGEAKAIIGEKTVKFINAQAGITNVGGLYYTLSVVFATRKGQGVCITLVTAINNKFETKEYKVMHVERPDIENAQMMYNAEDHKIYEAVNKIGSGSVIITEITNTHINGTFSGKFVLQGATSPTIEIKGGEFIANYTVPERDVN